MDILQDLYFTNRAVFKKSAGAVARNWKLFLVGIAYYIFSILIWQIASRAWILSGLIIAVFQSAVISNFLYLMGRIMTYGRFTLDDFKEGFKVYLWKVYSVLILIWFVRYGLGLFLGRLLYTPVGGVSLMLILEVVAFLALNALPEVIYQKYGRGFDMITDAFAFIKENWLEWLLPNILVGGLLTFVSTLLLPLTAGIGFAAPVFMVWIPLAVSFFMLYRGFLFKLLDKSTRRKRIYQYRMDMDR